MIDIDQVLTEVQSQASMLAELSTVVAELHTNVLAHADGKVIAPVVQDKIESVMAGAVANRSALADAMKLAAAANASFEAMKKNDNLA